MDELEDKSINELGQNDFGSFLNNYAEASSIKKVKDAEVQVYESKVVNLDDKFDSLLKGQSALNTDNEKLNNLYADEQDWVSASIAGIGYFGTQLVPQVVIGASNMLDIPEYLPDSFLTRVIDDQGEVGNWLGNAVKEWVADPLKEHLVGGVRTYQGEGTGLTDLSGDSMIGSMGTGEWWRNRFADIQNVATSASQYMIAGFGIGAAIRGGLQGGKALLGLEESVRAMKLGVVAEELAINLATNQMAGVQMAADKADELYLKHIGEGKTHDEAMQIASDAAANIVQLNRASMLLNINATKMFSMKGAATRGGAEALKQNTWKEYTKEGLQEAGEEILEGTSEQVGADMAERGERGDMMSAIYPSHMLERLNDIAANPWKAVEAGILGFAGGAGQQKLGDVLNANETLATSRFTNKMFGRDVLKMVNGEPVPIKDKEGNVIQYETERVSKAEANRRKYEIAKKQIAENEAKYGIDFMKHKTDVYADVEEMWAIGKELEEAVKTGDTKKEKELRNHLLFENVYSAAESGTLDTILSSFDTIMNTNYTKAQMKAQGIPSDYKERAKQGKEDALALEQEYLKSQLHPASKRLYDAKAAQIFHGRQKQNATKFLTEKKALLNASINEAITNGQIKPKNANIQSGGGDTYEVNPFMLSGGDYTNLWTQDRSYNETEKNLVEDFLAQAGQLFQAEMFEVDEANTLLQEHIKEEAAGKKAYTFLTGHEMRKIYDKIKKDKVEQKANEDKEAANTKALNKKLAEKNHQDSLIAKSKADIEAAAVVASTMATEEDEDEDEDTDEEVEVVDKSKKREQPPKNENKPKTPSEKVPSNVQKSKNVKTGLVTRNQTEAKANTRKTAVKVDTGMPAAERPPKDELVKKQKTTKEAAEINSGTGNEFVQTQDAEVQKFAEDLNELLNTLNPKKNPLDRPLTPEEEQAAMLKDFEAGQKLATFWIQRLKPIQGKLFGGDPTWKQLGDFVLKLLDDVDMFERNFKYLKGSYILVYGDANASEGLNDFFPSLDDVNRSIEHDNEAIRLDADEFTDDTMVAVYMSLRDDVNEDTKVGKTGIRTTKTFNKKTGQWEYKISYGVNTFAYLAIDPEVEGQQGVYRIKQELDKGLQEARIMSSKYYPVGTPLTIEMVEEVKARAITISDPNNSDKKITYGEYEDRVMAMFNAKQINAKTKDEWLDNNYPIVIKNTNGEVISYLHAVPWINEDNINADDESLQEQREDLLKLRRKVKATALEGKVFNTKINNKSNGVLLRNKVAMPDGTKIVNEPTNQVLPDKTLKIDIYNGVGGFKAGTEFDGDTSQMIPGATYIFLPMANGTILPVPLYNNNISKTIVDTVTNVLRAYMFPNDAMSKNIVQQINGIAKGGFDISTSAGLEVFLKMYLPFIPHKNLQGKSVKDYMDGQEQGRLGFYFADKGVLTIARSIGQGFNSGNIDKDKNPEKSASYRIIKPEKDYSNKKSEVEAFLKELGELLLENENTFLNFDANLLATDDGNPFYMVGVDNNGNVVDLNNGGSYKDWIRNNTASTFTSINIGTESEPDYIYSVQSVISFDMSKATVEEPVVLSREEVAVNSINPTVNTNKLSDIEKQKQEEGEVFVNKIQNIDLQNKTAYVDNGEMSLTGKPVNEGMNIIITESSDKMSENFTGEPVEVIYDTVSPQVMKDGKMIKAANVKIGLFDSIEAANTFIKELQKKKQKSKEKYLTKLQEIESKYAALESKSTVEKQSTKEQDISKLESWKSYPVSLFDNITSSTRVIGGIVYYNGQGVQQLYDILEIAAKYNPEINKLLSKFKIHNGNTYIGDSSFMQLQKLLSNDFDKDVTKFSDLSKVILDKVNKSKETPKQEVADTNTKREEAIAGIYQETEDNDFTTKGTWSSTGKDLDYTFLGLKTKQELIDKINAKYEVVESIPKTQELTPEQQALKAKQDALKAKGASKDKQGGTDKSKKFLDPKILSEKQQANIAEASAQIVIDELGANRQAVLVNDIAYTAFARLNDDTIDDNTLQGAADEIFDHIAQEIIDTKQEIADYKEVFAPTDFIDNEVDANGKNIGETQMEHEARLEGYIELMEMILRPDVKAQLIRTAFLKIKAINGIKISESKLEDADTEGLNLEKDQMKDVSSSFQTDSKKTCGALVRRFLSGLRKQTVDRKNVISPDYSFYGRQTYERFDDVFETLKILLGDIPPVWESEDGVTGVKRELEKYKYVHGWIQDLIDKLEAEKNNKDSVIFHSFLTAMSGHQINMDFISWDYDYQNDTYQVRLTSSNAQSLNNAIINTWTQNLFHNTDYVVPNDSGELIFKKDKAQELLKEYQDIVDTEVEFNSISFSDVEKFKTTEQLQDNLEFSRLPIEQPVIMKKATEDMIRKIKSEAYVTAKVSSVLHVTVNEDGYIVVERLKPNHSPNNIAKRIKIINWLSELGITIDELLWDELVESGLKVPGGVLSFNAMINIFDVDAKTNKKKKDKAKNIVYSPMAQIYNWLDKAVKDSDASGKPIIVSQDDTIFASSAVKGLAKFQSTYEKKISSTSFYAGKKQISSHTDNKYIIDRLAALKDPKGELINALSKLPFSKVSNCEWLRDIVLWDEDNQSWKLKEGRALDNFEVTYVSLQAIKKLGNRNEADKSLLDITPAEHEFFKLAAFTAFDQGSEGDAKSGTFTRWAKFLYPTAPAAKSSRMIVKAKVANVTFYDGQVSDATINMLYKALYQSEADRILSTQNSKRVTGISFYDTGATFFHFLPILNTIPELWDEDGTLKDYSKNASIQRKVKQVIREFIDAEVSKKLTEWGSYGIIGYSKKDEEQKNLRLKYTDEKYMNMMKEKIKGQEGIDLLWATGYDFEINQILATVNAHQVFVGDPAVFHKANAQYKELDSKLKKHLAIKEFMSRSKEGMIDLKNYDTDKEIQDKYAKQFKESDTEQKGLDNAHADTTIKAMSNAAKIVAISRIDNTFGKDITRRITKTVWDTIGKRLAADVAPGKELPNTEGEFVKYLFLADTKMKSVNVAYLKRLGYDYSEITATDAQEYTTWQEHLHIMFKMGKITEQQKDDWSKRIAAGESLNDKELKDVLQPMKPVYTNNIVDASNLVDRRMYIKSSSFPLLPQLTKNFPLLEKFRLFIENKDNNIQRVVYNTGIKIGCPVDTFKLWDKDGNMNELNPELIAKASLRVPRKGFRIQMDVPYKESKHSVNTGTQERKLLFANLRDMRDKHGNRITFNGKSVEQLEEEYNGHYGSLFKINYDRIANKIIDENTGKIIEEELQKLLKDECIERAYPLADLFGLDYKDGNFVIPIWANPSHKKFEALMISIIHNKILKTKFQGASFVLGSEIGMDSDISLAGKTREEYESNVANFVNTNKSKIAWTKNWQGKLYPGGEYYTNEDNSIRYTDEEYALLDNKAGLTKKVLPSQTLAPSKFRDNSGNLIDMTRFIDPVTKLIDTTRVPKELMEAFQFRIPSQGHSSMSWVEVVGFLPPEHGDLMIVSKDLTVQKGLDYDVDKEYQYHYEMELSTDIDSDSYIAAADNLDIIRERALDRPTTIDIIRLKRLINESPYQDKNLVSAETKALISSRLSGTAKEVFDAMPDSEIVKLNARSYKERHEGNLLTPLYHYYSEADIPVMSAIKRELTTYNAEWRAQYVTPRIELKKIYDRLSKDNEAVRAAEQQLYDIEHTQSKFKKITDGDATQSLYIPTTEDSRKSGQPKVVRVLVNAKGDIMNREYLIRSGQIVALSEALDGDIDEAIKEKAVSQFQEAIIHNKILDIHKQVLLHEAVQSRIFKPTSMGGLKKVDGTGSAIDIDADRQERNTSESFSPISSSFQRDKLTSGLAGSIGVGSYSLDSVFCALCEGKNIIMNELVPPNVSESGYIPLVVRFGNKTSESNISDTKVVGSDSKRKLDTIEAFQSIAVDNENEQVMDKINNNKFTFDFGRAMAQLGFDEDLIGAMMAQDSVIKYTDALFLNESSLNDDRVEEKNMGAIVLRELAGESVPEPTHDRNYPDSIDDLDYQDLRDMIKQGESYPNYKKLQVGILQKFLFLTKMGQQMKEVQGILKVDSSGVGKSLMNVAVKWDKFKEVMDGGRFENVGNLLGHVVKPSAMEAGNYAALGYVKQGDYMIKPSTIPGYALVYGLRSANRWFDKVIPINDIKGAFQKMMPIYLKNKQPTELELVDMFDELKSFLYTTDATKIIGSRIAKVVDGKYSGFISYKTIGLVREYLLTDSKKAIPNPDTKEIVVRENQSLATIINHLKRHTNLGTTNEFIRRLETKTTFVKISAKGKKRKQINTVVYNASPAQGLDETAIYAAFIDLITSDVEIGFFNGMKYTTKLLAQDLIAYNFAIGGSQGANNFAKYIPVAYLTELGFGKAMTDAINNMQLKHDPVKNEENVPFAMRKFIDQYVRHNPTMAEPFTKETPGLYSVEKGGKTKRIKSTTDLHKSGRLIIRSKAKDEIVTNWDSYTDDEKLTKYNSIVPEDKKVETLPDEATIFDEFSGSLYSGIYRSVRDSSIPGGAMLFKWDKKAKLYVRINTLGGHGVSEYDYENNSDFGKGLTSIFPINNTYMSYKDKTDISPNSKMNQNRFTMASENEEERIERHQIMLDDIMRVVDDRPQNDLMKEIAGYIFDNVEALKDVDVVIDNDLVGKGQYHNNTITINEYELSKGTDYKRARTVAEEYIHAITDKALSAKLKDLTPIQRQARARVAQNVKELKEHLESQINPETGKNLYQELKEALATKDRAISPKQRAFDYAAADSYEFLAAALLEPKVMKWLAAKDRIEKTNFVGKILNALAKFITTIVGSRDNRFAEVLEDFLILTNGITDEDVVLGEEFMEFATLDDVPPTEEEMKSVQEDKAEEVENIPETKDTKTLTNKVSKTDSGMSAEEREIARAMRNANKNLNPLIQTECN